MKSTEQLIEMTYMLKQTLESLVDDRAIESAETAIKYLEYARANIDNMEYYENSSHFGAKHLHYV